MAKNKSKEKPKIDFFVRKDFDWYDTGLVAVLSPNTVAVWEALCRYIWRGDDSNGYDCKTKTRQSKIADATGLSKRSVTQKIKELQELGFLRLEGIRENTMYKLGTWHLDENGKRVEEIYGAQIARQAAEMLTEYAKSVGKDRLSDLEFKERVDRLEEWLESGDHLTQQLLDPHEIVAEPQAMDASPLTQQLLDPHAMVALQEEENTKEDNFEVENLQKRKEKKANPGVLRTGISPPERSGGGKEVGVLGRSELATTERNKNYAPVTRRVSPTKAVLEAARARAIEGSGASLRKTQARESKILNMAGSKTIEGPDPAIALLERVWRKHYTANFPKAPLAKWGGQERGQTMQLVKKYDGPLIQSLFDYALNEWDQILVKLKNGPDVPSVGYLLKLHATLVPAAARYGEVSAVWREWQAWWDANPDASEPPEELEDRFEKHQKEIEKLGLLRRT